MELPPGPTHDLGQLAQQLLRVPLAGQRRSRPDLARDPRQGENHELGVDLAVPENLSLLPLPRYSPELNPVENVWEYLRQNKLGLRVWPDYEAIVATCCEAWNWLVAMPDHLASITRREWAKAVTN